ncbi:glycosyltransferase [Enterovibrio norvegicus]|uniref:glycosyltransferase n=1 Tax=Enterovibrio norvegicus TaxID=188144 RepID=UPI00352BF3BC
MTICDLKISYVVPAYNHARFISKSLESIKNDGVSSGYNFEIIIIDDGSIDATADIISDWCDNNKLVNVTFIRQLNQGITRTLNSLYSRARGEYIRPCSSDDIVEINSSKLMIDAFNENVSCVFGDCLLIDDDGNEVGRSSISYHRGNKHALTTGDLRLELIKRWCVAGPSLMLSREFVRKYRYDETSHIDDFDMFLTLIKLENEIVFVDESMCKYRIHSTNTSKTKNIESRIINTTSFLNLIYKHLTDIGEPTYHHELNRLSYYTQAKLAYLKGDYFKLLKSLIHYLLISGKPHGRGDL